MKANRQMLALVASCLTGLIVAQNLVAKPQQDSRRPLRSASTTSVTPPTISTDDDQEPLDVTEANQQIAALTKTFSLVGVLGSKANALAVVRNETTRANKILQQGEFLDPAKAWKITLIDRQKLHIVNQKNRVRLILGYSGRLTTAKDVFALSPAELRAEEQYYHPPTRQPYQRAPKKGQNIPRYTMPQGLKHNSLPPRSGIHYQESRDN